MTGLVGGIDKIGVPLIFSKDDFHIKMVDLDIAFLNSMVKMWKSTNEKIEDKLEELRA